MSIIVDKYLDCIYYLTIDNIFCMYINESNNDVHIYEYKDNDNDNDEDESEDEDDGYNGLNNYSVLIATYNPVKIFIGKSPLNQQTIFSGGHGPYFDGNTILLKLDTNNYVFIGNREIYSFTTEHEIVSFSSPIGNNYFPYAYAIDSEENFYFLSDICGIMKIDDVSKRSDPYSYLYSVTHNIGETENIEWLYTGNYCERFHMTTSTSPEYKYDRLIARDGGPISIQYKDQTKKELSKEEYVELLTNYNKKVGLSLISNITMIHKSIL